MSKTESRVVVSDNALIKQCQHGDRQAFDTLINQQYDIIYRIAYQWCRDQHNAQDIAQQACVKLASAIHQFRFEACFSSWLYRLVINCAKDFYKSPTQHRSQREVGEHDAIVPEPHCKSTAETLHYSRQILEHINHLPNELRDTLILIFGNGLNHRQAAERLDIKESTVSWRIHEARKLLRQTFESSTLHDSNPDSVSRGAI